MAAIKEATDNIRRVTDLRNAVGDRYQLFMGVDDLSFDGLAVGAQSICTSPSSTASWRSTRTCQCNRPQSFGYAPRR